MRSPSFTNCAIGKPLASGADDGEGSPLTVVGAKFGTVGVSEIESTQVAVQVGFRTVEVDAVDTALQDREVTFGRARLDMVPNILLGGVVDRLITAHKRPTDRGIDAGVVDHEPAVRMGMTSDDRVEIGGS